MGRWVSRASEIHVDDRIGRGGADPASVPQGEVPPPGREGPIPRPPRLGRGDWSEDSQDRKGRQARDRGGGVLELRFCLRREELERP